MLFVSARRIALTIDAVQPFTVHLRRYLMQLYLRRALAAQTPIGRSSPQFPGCLFRLRRSSRVSHSHAVTQPDFYYINYHKVLACEDEPEETERLESGLWYIKTLRSSRSDINLEPAQWLSITAHWRASTT